jgi:hypothetical protein
VDDALLSPGLPDPTCGRHQNLAAAFNSDDDAINANAPVTFYLPPLGDHTISSGRFEIRNFGSKFGNVSVVGPGGYGSGLTLRIASDYPDNHLFATNLSDPERGQGAQIGQLSVRDPDAYLARDASRPCLGKPFPTYFIERCNRPCQKLFILTI